MSALPIGWAPGTLSDVVQPSREKVEPSSCGELPYIGLEHIESGTGRLLGHGYARDVRSTKAVFRRGDVLYGKLRPYLRKVWRAEFDGVCSTDILVYPPSPAVDGGFLRYLMMSERITDYAVQASAGINLPRVNASSLGDVCVALPPLAEQQRIAAKLDELLSGSRAAWVALHAVPALLDQYEQAALAAVFRGDLTAGWRRGREKPLVTCGDCDKTSELAPTSLPDGWHWSTLGELVRSFDRLRVPLKDSDRRKRPGPFPYYGAFGVIDFLDDYIFDGEFLLLAEDGKNLLTRKRPIAMRADGRFWVNNHAHVLQARDGVSLSYLEHYLNSTDLSQFLTGIDQVKLTASAMSRVPVPVAPADEQERIVELLSAITESVSCLRSCVNSARGDLERMEKAALTRALSGQLVPQDPDDEPAATLLARLHTAHAAEPPGQPRRRTRAPA